MFKQSTDRRLRLFLSVAVIISWGLGCAKVESPNADKVLHKRAMIAARNNEHEDALKNAEDWLRRGNEDSELRLLAGNAARSLGRIEQAIEHWENVDRSSKNLRLRAMISAAEACDANVAFSHRTDTYLNEVLSLDFQNAAAHRQLAKWLALRGQRTQATAHWLAAIREGQFSIADLCYIAAPEIPLSADDVQIAEWVSSKHPTHWLAAACSLRGHSEATRAENLLKRTLQSCPQLTAAHIQMGLLLVEQGRYDELRNWDDRLPTDAEFWSETWNVRSRWARNSDAQDIAAYCAWKSVSIQPNQIEPIHQLGLYFDHNNRHDIARTFRQRAAALVSISQMSKALARQDGATEHQLLREMAERMESIGRYSEAIAWAMVAQHQGVTAAWPHDLRKRLFKTVKKDPSWTIAAFNPANKTDLSEFQWKKLAMGDASRSSESPAKVQYADIAAEAGIHHVYLFGCEPDSAEHRLFEFTGGGIAILDFDGDDWPDIFLTQAGKVAPFKTQTSHNDALYRNRQGVADEVAIVAGVVDFKFGQGVSAGDINNDGFADLYIANIDGNHLYFNNGDGTFTAAIKSCGIGHDKWTTSCAIADLNQDGLPDLLDITFVSDAYDKACTSNGQPRSCIPAQFDGERDRWYRNLGDGSFEEAAREMGLDAAHGDGLGVVIGKLTESAPASVFVANDGRPNFLFTANSTMTDGTLFQDQAFLNGVAVNQQGQAEACMGIACADFNEDLRLDLFVTNFYSETNTLYLQLDGQVFDDRTQAFGLTQPSRQMLGFGTQAIDGNMDGRPDLMVANGHVDNFHEEGIPYRMPIQYFHNIDGRKFEEGNSDDLGPAFQRKTLGRAMAVLDWNRDGKEDVAVIHLAERTSVLVNQTQQCGNGITVRVVGNLRDRDAVTTRVVASFSDRKIVRSIMAGDGYQSSNQKQLIFGIGTANAVDQLQIEWTGGETTMISNIPAGQSIVVRECDQSVFVIPK